MRKVLTLACLLAVAHHVAAQCSTLPSYSETLVPDCAQNDVYVNWPNYANQTTYYKCNGVGNPVLAHCPANLYFCFVLQQCVGCNQMIPAVPCSQLKTQNKPNCVPIEGGSTGSTGSTGGTTLPTPYYPSTTTTEKTTKATTEKTTKAPATTAVTQPTLPPSSTNPTPPTGSTGSSTSDIPPPPSPVTNDPNIPMPPTPGPTPPSVVVTPPNVPSAPVAG